jgi:response regulator of citrate/malate metabolism
MVCINSIVGSDMTKISPEAQATFNALPPNGTQITVREITRQTGYSETETRTYLAHLINCDMVTWDRVRWGRAPITGTST